MKIHYPIPNSRSKRDAIRDVQMRHREGIDWRVQQFVDGKIYLVLGGPECRMDMTPELQKYLQQEKK